MKAKLVKIWENFKALLKQGLTPKQLALSLVVSALVSIYPIYGISTIVLTALAIPLKLNLPIMIAFSFVIEPLKLLVLIPFINIGAWVFDTEHTLLSFEAIKASYNASFFETTKSLFYELICGTVGWALTAIPVSIVLYFILKAILTHFDRLKNQPIIN